MASCNSRSFSILKDNAEAFASKRCCAERISAWSSGPGSVTRPCHNSAWPGIREGLWGSYVLDGVDYSCTQVHAKSGARGAMGEARFCGTRLWSDERKDRYRRILAVLVLYTGARVYGQHGAYYATGHLTRLCEGALRGPPPRAPSNLYME